MCAPNFFFIFATCALLEKINECYNLREKPKFMNWTIAEGLTAVHIITEDKNANLWFGMTEGAFRLIWDKKSNLNKENFTGITTRQGLPHNNVNSILVEKKR